MPPKKGKGQEGSDDDADFQPGQLALGDPRLQAAIMQMAQAKLESLVGKAVHMEDLPEEVKERVEELKTLQGQYDELHDKLVEEQKALQAKYDALFAPLYEQRATVVKGEEAQGEHRGIPRFWLTVLQICPETAEMVEEKDVAALEALEDIRVEDLTDDESGFKVVFEFRENEFFSNTVLEKIYHMAPDDDQMLQKLDATPIEWKEGKDLTVKVVKKKSKKGGKNAKPVMKQEDADSFFRFFKPPAIPDSEDDMEAEEMAELHEVLEQDYAIGEMFRDQLVPEAVRWFTGEALEYDDEDDEDEDDDEEDDDEDEEDSGDEDDAGKGKEQPPECKQQ